MVYCNIESMDITSPIDIINGVTRVVFYSAEDRSVLDLSHDALNALRSLLMSSVDYPGNFFSPNCAHGEVAIPILNYEYHHDPANQHVYIPNPGNKITFTFNSNRLILLITGLTFNVKQYIIDHEYGVYIQPWYDKYNGKTMVHHTMSQLPDNRMIDTFCDRLKVVLPYDKSSPLNARVYHISIPIQ